MNNILKLKTVNKLLGEKFLIPAYQRGYRWTEKEILDLLNDINDFKPREVENSDSKTWYCLQPIVVKLQNENNLYEVIDGQQRLTTIYIILYFLNQQYTEEFQSSLFELFYETRSGSSDFLSKLKHKTDLEEINKNIDFYYIYEAYKTIKQWFKDKPSSFNRSEFESNFKFHTRVIWYESIEDDSISIFTRINIGKIPLTNSELIKALLLNSSNFEDKNYEKTKLRQLEIATEWDLIEHSLQRDRFWFFLNEKPIKNNRIEFIFNLMNDAPDTDDKYSTFKYFNSKFSNKTKKTIDDVWHQIKIRYQAFNEWFENRELYHKIGYLLCISQVDIKTLYNQSFEMTKSEFLKYIDGMIKNSISSIDLEELQYDDTDSVKKILLLYNITTLLNSDSDNSYFPFDLFKSQKWDIEHITSINDPSIILDKHSREKWLNDAEIFVDNSSSDGLDLKKKIGDFINYDNDEDFKQVFNDVVTHFNKYVENSGDVNHISNLTLLDSATNRSYKNAVFPVKRKTIIDRDKQGVFIPICTKNVFLKYFSEYPPKISFWTTEDREHYERDLYFTIEKYRN